MKSDKIKQFLIQNSILLILIFLCVILTIIRPSFMTFDNLINVLRQASVTVILAIGMTLIIITGGIDLAPGSVVAFAGVAACMFAKPGQPLILSIFVGLIVGGMCGLFSGILVAYTKIPPFIATLGVQQAARGAALILSGGTPVTDLSDSFRIIGKESIGIVPIPVCIFVILAIITHTLLGHTKLGKHIYAIGGNEQAATVCGIHIKKVKLIVYAFSGVLAGLASVILSSRVASANPSVGQGYEFDAITAAVIGGASLSGGIGTIGRTIVGALFIGVLNTGLTMMGVSPYYQQIIKGLLIVAAVILDTYKNKLKQT